MAHARKPDFVFRRNGRVHLNRPWASVQSTTGSRGVRISGSNAGYTMFRGSVKSTGYPHHSSVSPSLPLPCVTMCHHISAGLYYQPIFCAGFVFCFTKLKNRLLFQFLPVRLHVSEWLLQVGFLILHFILSIYTGVCLPFPILGEMRQK